jgi:hypothetical protein
LKYNIPYAAIYNVWKIAEKELERSRTFQQARETTRRVLTVHQQFVLWFDEKRV